LLERREQQWGALLPYKPPSDLYWSWSGEMTTGEANQFVTDQQDQQVQARISKPIESVLWESALEAVWKTLVLLILGNVAVSLLSGIFHDMAPSLPPVFVDAEASTHSAAHHWRPWTWLHRHTFLPVFATLFACLVWSRLRLASGRITGRVSKIARALGENWFGVIVGNALGAMLTAMVALWIPQFTWTQFIWQEIVQLIGPIVRLALELLFSESTIDRLHAWFAWFGQNQAKFDFWLIYFAAICDDLGIPNIKTFGRWLWRKMRAGSSTQRRKEAKAHRDFLPTNGQE
jgi:hypothetical protein